MLGLQCTESSIRAAAAKKSGQLLSVHARAEQKLGKDVFAGGEVLDQEKVIEALVKLKKTLKKSGKVTLCLSPRVVFTHLLRVPKVRSGRLTNVVRTELEAVLPEEIEDMQIHFTPIRRDKSGTRIAVTAVKKDILESYKDLLKKSKFSLGNVTTTGLALGDMLKHEDTFMLVNIEDEEPSIVVFIGGFPVDEQLLSSSAAQSVLSTVRSLLAEYKEDDMPVQHIAVHSSKEFFAKIEQGFIPKKVAKEKREEMEEAVTVEHVLPSLKKADLVWGGLIASSLGKGLDVRKSASSWPFMQTVLLGFFAVVAAYFVWTIGSVQILGVWAEIQSWFPISISL
jgi:hypothetical protein